MINILLPTDFSDQSWKAMSFAAQLYHSKAVHFHLIHSVPVPITETEVGIVPDMSTYLTETEVDLKRLQKRFEELDHQDETQFISHVKLGSLVDAIHQLEKDCAEKTVIVMGTTGASGLADLILGSNTTRVIGQATSPIIVVPKNAALNPIKHVVLALDKSGVQHKKEIQPLIDILDNLQCRLKIVHVQTDQETVLEPYGDNQLRLDQYLQSIDHAFDTLLGKYKEDALTRYAEKDHANLIALIKKDHGFWGNLFHRSMTKSMAFYGDIPLLILRGE